MNRGEYLGHLSKQGRGQQLFPEELKREGEEAAPRSVRLARIDRNCLACTDLRHWTISREPRVTTLGSAGADKMWGGLALS